LQIVDYQNNTERVKHREQLNEIIAKVVQTQTLDHWITHCKKAGVPAARIRDMKAVFERPEANAMILTEPGPKGEETKRLRTIAFKIK
jgi:crotonobetainyl-CoA:carnitine CoA-transferase CaiB-like acyl-CoA transferase